MTDPHSQKILILDFGSQFTQLIARRVREAGVYCEIYPYDITDAELRQFAPRGVILSGGPESVSEAEAPRAPQLVFDLKVPVLGICYGQQTMAAQLGGTVDVDAPVCIKSIGILKLLESDPDSVNCTIGSLGGTPVCFETVWEITATVKPSGYAAALTGAQATVRQGISKRMNVTNLVKLCK